jgi:hypothetical protein
MSLHLKGFLPAFSCRRFGAVGASPEVVLPLVFFGRDRSRKIINGIVAKPIAMIIQKIIPESCNRFSYTISANAPARNNAVDRQPYGEACNVVLIGFLIHGFLGLAGTTCLGYFSWRG